MKVIINKPDYILEPTRNTEESAGYDLYSPETFTIKARESYVVDTLISIAYEDIPDYLLAYCQIKGRSGLSINHGIEVCNAGVIDQDYRGTIKIKLYNASNINYIINEGDRIAQMLFFLLPKLNIEFINLNHNDFVNKYSSERGINGLGSSGK